MKKTRFFAAAASYLVLVALFSLDWPFWQGYLGLGLTFLTVFVFSFPLVVALAGVGVGIADCARKKSAWHSWLGFCIGAVMILDYILSFSGVFSGSALLGAAYAVLPVGTLALSGLWCARQIAWKRSKT